MNWTDLNLIPAMPEIVLLTALCAVLLVDLWLPDEKRGITAGLAILCVLAAAVFQVASRHHEQHQHHGINRELGRIRHTVQHKHGIEGFHRLSRP